MGFIMGTNGKWNECLVLGLDSVWGIVLATKISEIPVQCQPKEKGKLTGAMIILQF